MSLAGWTKSAYMDTGFEFDIINYPHNDVGIRFQVSELETNQYYEFAKVEQKLQVISNNTELSNSSMLDRDPTYLDGSAKESVAVIIAVEKTLQIGEPVQMCIILNQTKHCEQTAIDKNHWAIVRLDISYD
jgi:hypothetical protein